MASSGSGGGGGVGGGGGGGDDTLKRRQLDVLLAQPTEDAEFAYYARLTAPGNPGHGNVVVKRVTHGKGLVAARDFAEGDRVLVEPPLVAMQQETNRADALVCGECLRYVGSVEEQIARRLLNDDGDANDGDAAASIVDPGFLRQLLGGEKRLPGSELFPMPPSRRCPGGGREVYCSQACETKAWESHEKWMCAGDGSGSKPDAMREFIDHAKETNDIFILTAKVLIRVASQANNAAAASAANADDSSVSASGKRPEESSNDDDDAALSALAAAWEPFAMGHKAVWWETMARPDDVAPGAEEDAFRGSMRDIAQESLKLLVSALPSDVVDAYPGLFSLEVFSRVIGMFELNNLEIVVASHVEDYFLHVDDLEEGSADKIAAQPMAGPLLDALDTGYDTPCEGTGFFALQSCVNSDCDPNVAPLKDEEDRDGACVLVAKRDVKCGEELTMCYVNESADLASRRAELADYGFLCRCEKCVREEAGLGQPRRGSKTK